MFPRFKWWWRTEQAACWPAAWLVAGFFAFAPNAAQGELRRWAVIASAEVRKSGLAELLATELSKLPGVELVERDQLDRIREEWALEPLSAATGIGPRLKAGRLLGADALLILSPVADDVVTGSRNNHALQVIICDCRLGARLATFESATISNRLDEIILELVAEVQRVRTHFAEGVRLVIGVSPFLSRNLEHHFDHLQLRYGDLLARSLSLQPSVAVIETNEAHAILKERSLTRIEPVDRTVPFIVSGHFRMKQEGTNREPTVGLTVTLSANGDTRELLNRSLPLSQVPAWIMNDVARQVLVAAGEKAVRVTSDEQRTTLIRQADAFSRLGDWPRSLGLREAALVLAPSNAEQRARLVDDYQRANTRDFNQLWNSTGKADPKVRRLLELTTDRYLTALDHLEYLVRNRQVGRDEAMLLFRWQKWVGLGATVPNSAERLHFDEQPGFRQMLDAERRFVIELMPQVLDLPFEATLPGVILPPQVPNHPEPWEQTLLRKVLLQVEFWKQDRRSLEYLAHVLMKILPKDSPTDYEMRLFLRQYTRQILSDRKRQADNAQSDWANFLQTLLQSDNDTARLYGRLGVLEQHTRNLGEYSRGQSVDRNAVLAVVKESDDLLYEIIGRRPMSDDVFHSLFDTRRILLSRIDPELNPDSPKELPASTSLGRLRFKPLPWTIADGGTSTAAQKTSPPLFQSMLNCGNQFDVFWTEKTFYLMNDQGVLRPLPLEGHPKWSKNGAFSNVTWDGECIWLLVAGWGIYVLDAQGNHLTTFNVATPLPGIDKAIQILPLGPRRMLAVGSFGEHIRAWFGILEVTADNQPKVSVFFEAKRVEEGRTQAEANADPETAFLPSWIHRLNRNDGKQVALVGRKAHTLLEPLAVDLDSLSVSVIKCNTGGWCWNDSFFSHHGRLIHRSRPSVFVCVPQDSETTELRETRLFHGDAGYWNQLLPYDGWVYAPGHTWQRIRQDTLEVEYLFQPGTTLPHPYRGLRCGVSAHYGLIGYRRYLPHYEADAPVLFQITVAEK